MLPAGSRVGVFMYMYYIYYVARWYIRPESRVCTPEVIADITLRETWHTRDNHKAPFLLLVILGVVGGFKGIFLGYTSTSSPRYVLVQYTSTSSISTQIFQLRQAPHWPHSAPTPLKSQNAKGSFRISSISLSITPSRIVTVEGIPMAMVNENLTSCDATRNLIDTIWANPRDRDSDPPKYDLEWQTFFLLKQFAGNWFFFWNSQSSSEYLTSH